MDAKRLFVAMPYKKRKAPLDTKNPDAVVEIDFDAVWTEILQPAIPEGFLTKRADELHQPGLIDRLYNEWLYAAEIVLADLTFGNPNVYYELGIRQTLSKKGTVLVACQGTELPFDVRNQSVIYYDYFSAPSLRQFQKHLRQSIENATNQEVDSPVHVYLPGLSVTRGDQGTNSSTLVKAMERRLAVAEDNLRKYQARESEERLRWKIEEATTGSRILSLLGPVTQLSDVPISLLELLGIKLRKFGFLDQALDVFRQAVEQQPSDPELLRELGFVYRKKGPSFYKEAEKYMQSALQLNDADAELHGMYGGLLKRRNAYGDALTHYQRAYELEPTNLYPIINLGAIHAASGNQVEAKRWYAIVLEKCDQVIAAGSADYWTYLCQAEARVAAGTAPTALKSLAKAKELEVPVEDLRSTTEQLEFFLRIGFESETARVVLSKVDLMGDKLSAPVKTGQSSNRLVIGCNISPHTDERGIRVYDMYLPISNNGPTDSFIVQIISIQPPPANAASLPWSLRWEGGNTEFKEILHDQERTLHFCRTDLTGEIHDRQTGHWKPARVWFFTPEESKEVFIPTEGVYRSSDLYDLRIDVTIRITVRSIEKKIIYTLTIGFLHNRTDPQLIRVQEI